MPKVACPGVQIVGTGKTATPPRSTIRTPGAGYDQRESKPLPDHVLKMFSSIGYSLFFLRLPSNAFPNIGSVGLKKKKPKKKITRRLGIVGPGTPGRR